MGPSISQRQKTRTPENLDKACEAAGLEELPERYKSEREFYRDLMYEFWILFDDKMRSICGVEIDLDLDHVCMDCGGDVGRAKIPHAATTVEKTTPL